MKNILFISLTLLVGLSSCDKGEIEGMIKTDKRLANELRSSPETITIGNNNLILITSLWRDFMPITEEGGSNMICINRLTEIDSVSIINTISLKKQFVVKGDEIWIAEYDEINNDIKNVLEGVVREGPKWGPNIEVDVVCEFENMGTTYRIVARSQNIGATN